MYPRQGLELTSSQSNDWRVILLGILLPNFAIAFYIPWNKVGVVGIFFPIIFMVSIWIVIEFCHFVRKRPHLFEALGPFSELRRYEGRMLRGLVFVWVGILLYLVAFQIFVKIPVGAWLDSNWLEIQRNNFLFALISKFPPGLLMWTGVVLGFSIDTAKYIKTK